VVGKCHDEPAEELFLVICHELAASVPSLTQVVLLLFPSKLGGNHG
jgi:hypothetical protein